MRVLVTGASGFLGRHLVTRLAAGGVHTTALCLERGPLPAEVEFVHADVRDRAAVAAAVAAAAPDAIVHLAALSHVGDSWKRMPDYFEEDLARYRAISPDDVQSAAKRFLPKDRRVELIVTGEKK